jgi:hypothetical protein
VPRVLAFTGCAIAGSGAPPARRVSLCPQEPGSFPPNGPGFCLNVVSGLTEATTAAGPPLRRHAGIRPGSREDCDQMSQEQGPDRAMAPYRMRGYP